jgi:hypothetical protein
MTERTVIITITRKANRRTVEFDFGESDLENLTLAGTVNNPNDKDKFEELAEIMPGLHALDNNASQAWDRMQESDEKPMASATAVNKFAIPDDAMSELRRFRLRYTNPS